MSHCSQTFPVDFMEFYWKDDIWNFLRNLREIQYNDGKELIDSKIDL